MKILDQNPVFLEAMNLADAGNFSSAIVLLQKLELIYLTSAKIKFYIGLTQLNLGHYELAVKALKKAIKIDSSNNLAYQAMGTAFHSLDKFDEAVRCFNAGIKLNTNYPDIYNDKALSLVALERFEEALICFDIAIKLDSTYIDAYDNQGIVYYVLRQYENAIISFNRALAIDNNVAEVYSNKGVALAGIKKYEDALVCYRRSIELKPDYAESHHNLADLYFTQLNFKDAWLEYRWRFLTKKFNSRYLKTSKKEWIGDVSCKHLFIWSEQGLGDQILYASMLNYFDNLDIQITLSADKKLLPIFRRSFPKFTVIDNQVHLDENSYDEQISIGGLGQYLRTDVEKFPKSIKPYLLENPNIQSQVLLSDIFVANKSKLKCGISWRSLNPSIGGDKSIELKELAEILSLQEIDFINLQYGDTKQDILSLDDSCKQKIKSLEEIDAFENVDGLLSVIAACDVILTISNTTAHLAGALGKKTLLLLPYSTGKIWYWNELDGQCLWYPSVKIFQQSVQGDWSEPLNNVKRYLGGNF